RTEAAESRVFGAEVQLGKAQLQRDEQSGEEADYGPEHGGYDAPADGVVVVTTRIGGDLENAIGDGVVVDARDTGPKPDAGDRGDDPHVRCESSIMRAGDGNDRNDEQGEPHARAGNHSVH